MRILMVCLGNICRSPIAEGVMQHKIKEHGLGWVVSSAGTESYHVGEAPQPWSQKVCRDHGIDISHQRSVKFTKNDLYNYDKIYAMATDVYEEMRRIVGYKADMSNVDLFLNELHPGQNESVPDPYGGPEYEYEFVYELVDATCNAIIKKYKTPHV